MRRMILIKTGEKRFRKAVLLLLALLTVTGSFVPLMTQVKAAAKKGTKAVTVTVKNGERYSYGSKPYSTVQRWVTHINGERVDLDEVPGKKTSFAYCLQPALATPDSGTYEVIVMDDDSTGKAARMRKAAYYSLGGYGYSKVSNPGWFEKQDFKFMNVNKYTFCHVYLSWCYDNYSSDSDAFTGVDDRIRNACRSLRNYLDTLPSPPDDFETFLIKISGCQDTFGALYMSEDTGKIRLKKKSLSTEITGENANYSLKGAVFEVYDADGDLEGQLVTNSEGVSGELELETGTYTIKEKEAPEGFEKNTDSMKVTVEKDEVKEISVKDSPLVNVPELLLKKYDDGTLTDVPMGGASLMGAVFEAVFSDGKNNLKKWYFETDENGRILLDEDHLYKGEEYKSDELYVYDGKAVLPLGKIVFREVKAPEGYLKDSETVTAFIEKKPEVRGSDDTVYNIPDNGIFREVVKRGDITFDKKLYGERIMKNIPFKITSLSTGEWHIVVTDSNGYVNTSRDWNEHDENMNMNDSALSDDGTVDEAKLNPDAGIWFSKDREGNEQIVDSETEKGGKYSLKGALPYGKYELQELKVRSNEGYKMIKTEFDLTRNGVTLPLGSFDNNDEMIPEIKTRLTDDVTETNLGITAQKERLTDAVKYVNLEKGKRYVMFSKIILKNDENRLAIEKGTMPKALSESKTEFTPENRNGEVKVHFEINSKDLKGKSLVCFEYLYDEDDHPVCSHEDIEDEGQTVRYPDLGTKATDKATGDSHSVTGRKVTLTDTVSLSNLVKGKKYELTGRLMDKSTGKPVIIDGKPVVQKTSFRAASENMNVKVYFRIDSTLIEGKDTVFFESLAHDSHELAVHADINDEGQTLHFPKIRTRARNESDGSGTVRPGKMITVTDTITYHNLKPGEEYTVKGKLMNGTTGKPVRINGKEITASKTFVPEKRNGKVDVTFTFKMDLKGIEKIVVFEDLYRKKVRVAFHHDLSDRKQTLKVVSGVPKTGDESKPLGYLALLSSSSALAAAMIRKRGSIAGVLKDMGN